MLKMLAMVVLLAAISTAAGACNVAIMSLAFVLPIHPARAAPSVCSSLLMLSVAAHSFQPANPSGVPSSVSNCALLMLPPSKADVMRWAVIIDIVDFLYGLMTSTGQEPGVRVTVAELALRRLMLMTPVCITTPITDTADATVMRGVTTTLSPGAAPSNAALKVTWALAASVVAVMANSVLRNLSMCCFRALTSPSISACTTSGAAAVSSQAPPAAAKQVSSSSGSVLPASHANTPRPRTMAIPSVRARSCARSA